MLANNFLSAEALELSEAQVAALQKTLVLMETGKLKHVPASYLRSTEAPKFDGMFNMDCWCDYSSCGTVACIGGTAELVGGVKFSWGQPRALGRLFFPACDGCPAADYHEITVEQAARALRNYLTVGEPRWAEVLA